MFINPEKDNSNFIAEIKCVKKKQKKKLPEETQKKWQLLKPNAIQPIT